MKHVAKIEEYLVANERNVICIGEVGLDHTVSQFKLTEADLEEQEQVFNYQIDLSKQFDKPLFVCLLTHDKEKLIFLETYTPEVLQEEQLKYSGMLVCLEIVLFFTLLTEMSKRQLWEWKQGIYLAFHRHLFIVKE